MPPPAALPFVLRRAHSAVRGREVTETRETAHGLLRLEPTRLVVQWSTARETSRVGPEIRVDRELEPVREVALPLAGIAGAVVRRRWRLAVPRWEVVLRAADLRAFAALAGQAGLVLEHPAELALAVRRADRAAAAEFAGELELALAGHALESAEERARVGGQPPGPLPGPPPEPQLPPGSSAADGAP